MKEKRVHMFVRANLFIIGAMKSGTTSIHEYLSIHPEICMSEDKEPGYFVEEMSLNRGEDWYQSLFKGQKKHKYYGEASTHYTKFPRYKSVAERIHNYNPDAKLIYIMRNPFERMISHYWHEVRAAHSGGEINKISAAIKKNSDYMDFSNYPLQLKQYYKFFPKSQVYIVTFEELVNDPKRVTVDIFRWLQLEDEVSLSEVGRAFNAKPEVVTGVAGVGFLNKIQHSKIWNNISPLIPGFLKDIAKKSAYKEVDISREDEEVRSLKKQLSPVFIEQIKELEVITGRQFPEWGNV